MPIPQVQIPTLSLYAARTIASWDATSVATLLVICMIFPFIKISFLNVANGAGRHCQHFRYFVRLVDFAHLRDQAVSMLKHDVT